MITGTKFMVKELPAPTWAVKEAITKEMMLGSYQEDQQLLANQGKQLQHGEEVTQRHWKGQVECPGTISCSACLEYKLGTGR